MCGILKNIKVFFLDLKNLKLPDGLGIKQDVPGGHNTIYPTKPMPLEKFFELVRGLPWEFIGKY